MTKKYIYFVLIIPFLINAETSDKNYDILLQEIESLKQQNHNTHVLCCTTQINLLDEQETTHKWSKLKIAIPCFLAFLGNEATAYTIKDKNKEQAQQMGLGGLVIGIIGLLGYIYYNNEEKHIREKKETLKNELYIYNQSKKQT